MPAAFGANHLITVLRHGQDGDGNREFALSQRRIGDLWSNAGRIAAVLMQSGVRPGDRVAVQAEKSLEFIETYLGTVLAGAVFLPLNPAYTDAEMGYFLADSEPAVLVADPARQAGLAGLTPARLLTLDATGGGTLSDAARAARPAAPVPRGPEDLAAILYTSGTTGRAKGAMLSHRALASNAQVLAREWCFTADDILIHALPVFHTHGLFVATNTVLVAGARVIFQHGFDADAIVRAMKQATVLMGVPTFYTRLLPRPGLAEAASGMRLFVSGSAPLLAETHRQWQQVTGHAILERYGMTETNMNTSNPYAGARRAGTVGLPLPGVELRLTGVADGIGMIELRGPNLFSGYWRMPDKTAEDMREGGWFATGDLGRRDADGYLSIVGRARDLVISGGMNVYPKEVEDVIDALPGVTESAVIGVPHPDLGEAVVAVVVAGTATEGQIRAGIAPVLARFKQPRHIALVADLPRNAMGKVQKKGLREQFANLFGPDAT